MDEITEVLTDLQHSKTGRKKPRLLAPYWTTRKRWDEDELHYLIDSYKSGVAVSEIISNLPERNDTAVYQMIAKLKRRKLIKKNRGMGPQKGEAGRPLKDLGPRPPCPRCGDTHIVSFGKQWGCRKCGKFFIK